MKSSRKGADGSELSFTELAVEAAAAEESVAETEVLSVAVAPAAVADPCALTMDAATSGLMVCVELLAEAVPVPLERTICPRVSGCASIKATVGPARMLLALARFTTLLCKGLSSDVT